MLQDFKGTMTELLGNPKWKVIVHSFWHFATTFDKLSTEHYVVLPTSHNVIRYPGSTLDGLKVLFLCTISSMTG